MGPIAQAAHIPDPEAPKTTAAPLANRSPYENQINTSVYDSAPAALNVKSEPPGIPGQTYPYADFAHDPSVDVKAPQQAAADAQSPNPGPSLPVRPQR